MNATVTTLNETQKGPQAGLALEHGGFNDSSENGIDLFGLTAIIRRRIHIIIGMMALITALAAAYTFSLTPRYTATAQLLLKQHEKSVLEQESVAAGLPTEDNAVDTEVEVLKSPYLAMRIIETFDLLNDAEFNPPENNGGAPGDSLALENATPQRQNEILKTFQQRTSVNRVGLTYVVEVSFSSQDPEKAANIANAIADEYINDQISAKLDANTRANDWLAQRLIKLRDDVLASEKKAAQFRAEQGLTDAKGTLLNEQQISELNAQLIQAEADLAEKRARLERIETIVRDGGDLGTVTEVVRSPTISRLREQQAEVVRNRAELNAKYGARHPAIIKVDREYQDLSVEIRNEVNRIVASLRNDMDIAGERARSLDRSLTGLKVENSEDNQVMVELRQLEREAEASRTLYEAFLERFKETSEASLFEDADARIIASASPPSAASWPNKKLNLILALAVSGALGIGIAYIIDSMDNGLRTVGEVESATALPVLASVPLERDRRTDGKQRKNGERRKSSVSATLWLSNLISKKPFSQFSESWRNLAASVTLSDVDRPPKVFLMASALPQEGKTLSSLCFTRELARANNKVLLVDCDFRRASLTRALMSSKKLQQEFQERQKSGPAGLIELLSGECALDDALMPLSPTMNVLPLLPRPSAPSRLLMSEAFGRLIADLRTRFDYVVIDSAPILPVADTRLLAAAADAVIFAVRWEQTSKQAVQTALKTLTAAQARIAGILMTFVDTRKQQRYGYSDYIYHYPAHDSEKEAQS